MVAHFDYHKHQIGWSPHEASSWVASSFDNLMALKGKWLPIFETRKYLEKEG